MKTNNSFWALFILLNLFSFTNSFSQRNKVEISTLLDMSLVHSTISYLGNDNSDEREFSFYPLSIYLDGRASLFPNFYLEARLGLIYGGENFSGIEYGGFLRYYLNNSNFFLVSGFIFHNNFGDAHGTTHYVEITDNIVGLVNATVGYKLNNNFNLLLSYYHPVESYLIYHAVDSDSPTAIPTIYDASLTNIFKIGLEYGF